MKAKTAGCSCHHRLHILQFMQLPIQNMHPRCALPAHVCVGVIWLQSTGAGFHLNCLHISILCTSRSACMRCYNAKRCPQYTSKHMFAASLLYAYRIACLLAESICGLCARIARTHPKAAGREGRSSDIQQVLILFLNSARVMLCDGVYERLLDCVHSCSHDEQRVT